MPRSELSSESTLLGGGSRGISRTKQILVIVVIAIVIAVVVIGVSLALHYRSEEKNVDVSASLSVVNILGHLKQLNTLADTEGGGSRSVMDAYNASALYVMDTLLKQDDFCDIQTQHFWVPIYVQLAAPTLTQVTPLNVSYVLNRDFSGTRYGGNGSYDIVAETVVAANYGCNYPEDFEGNFTGNIAVVFDGNCTQYQKALNAELAHAAAILIVNGKGNALANWRVRSVGWNSSDPLVQIPVLGITYSLGLTLREAPGTQFRVTTSTEVTIEPTFNVLCLTRKGSEHSIVVMGAHLDSVPEGPGINDNGSGSASVLEVALEVARSGLSLDNKILFAWWGAEEIGLLGSRYFVHQLLQHSQESYVLPPKFNQSDFLPSLYDNNTLLNLNFDMLGSPNFNRQVYNSTAQTRVVNDASYRIGQLFEEFFKTRNVPYEIVPMSGGSDFFPFIENGFPAGALATGAGALKSVADRDKFGGLANAALDPCYHLSCDTVANINQGVLEDMSKGAAYVVQKLATESDLRKFLYE